MEENKYLAMEAEIVSMIKMVYDPEIPVNIYDLGLIYKEWSMTPKYLLISTT